MTIHPRLLEKLETMCIPSADFNTGTHQSACNKNGQFSETREDGRTTKIPVILYYCKPRDEVRQCILRRYGSIKYELPFINAMALDLPPEKVKLIARERMVQWITEDVAVSKIGAGEGNCDIRNDYGGNPRRSGACGPTRRVPLSDRPSGRPVTVAVIDTGVALHPDLLWPVNRIRSFYDLIGHQTEPYDDDGHGTHIAGIIAGLASWPGQKRSDNSADLQMGRVVAERGWNPDIAAIKALDGEGNGSASDILAAMQWTVNNRRHLNIRVVNLSLGVSAEHEADSDPLLKGVEALTRFGLCVVAAAGNSGPKAGTISSPGISPYAITVGAAEPVNVPHLPPVPDFRTTHPNAFSSAAFRVASFSGRGPTPQGLTKPDLLAPGVDILSLDAAVAPAPAAGDSIAAATSTMPAAATPQTAPLRSANPPGYIRQSGTSMAAPFVSRAVAGLCKDYPFAGPRFLKELLLHQTIPLNNEPPQAQGRGVLIP